MAETTAILGFGVALLRNGSAVAEITNVGGPSLARDSVEATNHQSPNRWREFLKGLKDGGEVSLDINYLPANSSQNASTGLLSDFAVDNVIDSWALTWPNGTTTWTFKGFITGFEPGAPIDDVLKATITIKVTGQPVLS